MSLNIETLATETSTFQCENDRSNGRWTKEEHQRFVDAIKVHGKNWKKVEECVGSRTGAQIRSHAQKFFLKLEKELKTSQKGKSDKVVKAKKNASEKSLSTSDSLSDLGKSGDNLKGNLSLNEICENLTEASETSALPTTTDNLLVASVKSIEDVSKVATKSNDMQAETDYSKLSKAQLLSKLKACEEKVDGFHQLVKSFTAAQTTSTSPYFTTPFAGKSYHHFVYLDLMSYFANFNKTTKSLKISDFVDLSCKTSAFDENSYEIPAGKKKVKVL